MTVNSVWRVPARGDGVGRQPGPTTASGETGMARAVCNDAFASEAAPASADDGGTSMAAARSASTAKRSPTAHVENGAVKGVTIRTINHAVQNA